MVAPWQIYFYIIPDFKYSSEISVKWDNPDIIYSVEAYFRKNLWKTDGIKENIIQYGNINETAVEIFCENDTFEVMVSLDLRSITEAFVDDICELCSYMDAVIMTKSGDIIKSVPKNIISLIANSESAKFCMYIEPYLAKMRDEIEYAKHFFWESYVPEKRKLKTLEEIEGYILEYIRKRS